MVVGWRERIVAWRAAIRRKKSRIIKATSLEEKNTRYQTRIIGLSNRATVSEFNVSMQTNLKQRSDVISWGAKCENYETSAVLIFVHLLSLFFKSYAALLGKHSSSLLSTFDSQLNQVLKLNISQGHHKTHHVPPNRYIFFPITMHDCLRRAFGDVPRVSTRCQTFLTGSKQCKSLKCRSRSPL